MGVNSGIFGDNTNLRERFVRNHKKLADFVRLWKSMGLKVVLVSGTFDLLHVGHAEYLEKAKELGDILVVGVDSDAKVRKRKGPNRPVVPESERVQIISHIRHADVITIKDDKGEPNALIKLLKPDVLVVSKTSKHSQSELKEKRKHCKVLKVLEPQSQTSTSAKVRLMHITGADQFAKDLVPEFTKLIEERIKVSTQELSKQFAAEVPRLIDESLQRLHGSRKR